MLNGNLRKGLGGCSFYLSGCCKMQLERFTRQQLDVYGLGALRLLDMLGLDLGVVESFLMQTANGGSTMGAERALGQHGVVLA